MVILYYPTTRLNIINFYVGKWRAWIWHLIIKQGDWHGEDKRSRIWMVSHASIRGHSEGKLDGVMCFGSSWSLDQYRVAQEIIVDVETWNTWLIFEEELNHQSVMTWRPGKWCNVDPHVTFNYECTWFSIYIHSRDMQGKLRQHIIHYWCGLRDQTKVQDLQNNWCRTW